MSHPMPIPFDMLPCPACAAPLQDDADGTRCTACDGVLVHRTWATRAAPELGRPALSPAYIGDARKRTCAVCRRDMGPVLCHGVLAWSCARCRFLFFDGPKHEQLLNPRALPPPPSRALSAPALVSVVAERVRQSHPQIREAFSVLLLAAIVMVALAMEVRPG